MIVDFHTHIFPPEIIAKRAEYAERDEWFSELYRNPSARMADCDTLISSMAAAGVDHSVICGFPWRDSGLCAYHNDYLIESVRRFPTRLTGFAIVQPATGARSLAELDRCLAAGMRGVGEINADAQAFSLEDKATLAPLVEALTARGIPILIHSSEPEGVGRSYPGKGRANPGVLCRFLSDFPDLTVVFAHWGGGLAFYELMKDVANLTVNVYYDTAASLLLYRSDIFRFVSDSIGCHKILFGTDFPLLRQERFLSAVRNAGLAQPVLNAILGENAARLLGL